VKKILLDTHVFLWWIDNTRHNLIGEKARVLICDPENEIYVSAASAWEISIKKSMGALVAPDNIDSVVEDKGFFKLAISVFHAEQAGSLPMVKHPQTDKAHKDPFDRMLVAQAQAEGMYFMTKDKAFGAYAVRFIDAEK
jgi:PIN domain nuclease of toxin-antitoxin system